MTQSKTPATGRDAVPGAIFDAENAKPTASSGRDGKERPSVAPLQGEPVAWLRQEWNGTGQSSLVFQKPVESSLREEALGVIYTPLFTHPTPDQPCEPFKTHCARCNNNNDKCPPVQAVSAVPSGWKLVPIEPTQAMCQAGQDKAREWPSFPLRISPIYQAMLAASPAASAPAPQVGMTDERIELRELCKLSWRAMCDAEAVIRAIDPESATEGEQLRELSGKLSDCAMHLFTALREPTQEWAKAVKGRRAILEEGAQK